MKKILATLMLAGFTGVFTLVPSLGRSTFGIASATASGTPSSSRPVHPINHRAEEAWFYGQRAAPRRTIPARAWLRAQLQRIYVLTRTHVHGYALPTWTQIGPAPTGTSSATSGRVSALAYDSVHKILYAGAAEGGLWKSTNRGRTWTPLTDDQPSLAVGSIALDPSNPQIIYIGTGEENFTGDAYPSAGVLKSTDGGSTWRRLGASTFAAHHNTHIGRIAVDPHNTAHVLAAADDGLFLSTDGGSSWRNTLARVMTDLIVDPSTNPSTVYAAAARNGIFKSTDGGSTWTLLGGGAPSGTRIGHVAIAQARSNPQQLYLVATGPNNDRSLGMWASSDAGARWTQVTPAVSSGGPDLLGADARGSDEEQGWYDMYVAVDPASASTVYVGGINVFKSTDAGATFTDLTNVYTTGWVHPDQHALVFTGPGSFYAGNDGGVYSSTDGGTSWKDSNGNLAITEFYAGSTTANFPAKRVIYGGAQDNGTQKYTGSPVWAEVFPGDGGFTANDPSKPDTAYEEYAYLQIYKTTDGGATWTPATTGIHPYQPSLFIAPFVMDPTNPNHLLAGTDHLYETTNGARSWVQISRRSLAADPFNGGAISAIAIAPSAPTTTFYVGTSDGKIWVTTNHGRNWTDITVGAVGTFGRYVTSLAVNPANAQDVVVTFSGFTNGTGRHVYRSTNGGASWRDISAGLPNSPVNSVLRDPSSPNTLFIGADDGFFFTTDGGATWMPDQIGLPNVVIDQLFSDAKFTTLIAATHGRGMFTLSPLRLRWHVR